jgi:hypothetical protein
MSNTFPPAVPHDSAGDDPRATASTSSPRQERAQPSSDFLREGRPRPAYTTPLDMSAEMEALATLPPGAARGVARSQPTISRPAVMNGELGVFVPLSALHEGVGVAEPLDPDSPDEAGESGAAEAFDGATPAMPEDWYQAQVARQPVVSSGRWGVDSQDITDSGSLDAGRMARRNAGKAWSRLLRLGQPTTLGRRLGGLALTAVILVTVLSLLTAFIFTTL